MACRRLTRIQLMNCVKTTTETKLQSIRFLLFCNSSSNRVLRRVLERAADAEAAKACFGKASSTDRKEVMRGRQHRVLLEKDRFDRILTGVVVSCH